ncbi:cytochrome-c peroxidase [Stieleria varia]|uniref:Cytochrome c551 peroxidase n=1 Tax=Stieleria varia TaxID=2528005 RepID=A0A5C6A3C0_9BACT|nr:cytochrome c peroxidase [Stieleria varia]TWT94404.1 Cytochrome c551 peroxidase precursor [Stieleria varia]
MLRRTAFRASAGLLACFAAIAIPANTWAEPKESDSPKPSTVVLGEDTELLKGIPGEGGVTMEQVQAWLADPTNHEPLTVKLPKGLSAAEGNIYIPADNPMTRAKIELGRQLYFDTRLSNDNTISCASCHDPSMGYGANTQFGVGVLGQTGGRNSPVSYNRIISTLQFWDGRAASLEEQAVGPIANPIEMGNSHDACIASLKKIPVYTAQFNSVFSDGVTIDNVGRAIAAFERTLVTGPAPYDYQVQVDQFEKVFADDLEFLDEEPELKAKYDAFKKAAASAPMSESAKRGMKLFAGKANCAACHAGANFSDEQYHNLGVGMDGEKPDLGRYEITKEEKDKGAFKTPTLRNVALSAPYMHDGSQKTLEEVVEWYNKGGHKNPWLSDKMKPLNLTPQEAADVVAFMKEGLTGTFPEVETNRLPE